MTDINKLNLSKYDVISVEKLEDLDSTGLLLRHKKSGARIAIVSNDDNNKVFSIGFKTPPYNDTGLQHILEHSTLCGSRKYPVKDPFVELCKGSLNTFLNAMTYPDKTVYPVASCNDVDFKNIMDVYMDAVFYPDIYNKPQIFKQEGWHYELENEDDELKINGVVYNEMKGVYSSPDDVLSRYTCVSLFPDTPYRFESGGEPAHIPELDYNEFLDYHKKFYHPVNSYIYLYGDMDVQERLDYLDREYLSDFDADDVEIDASIPAQKSFENDVFKEFNYAVTDDEPLENNAFLSYNKVVGTSLDAKLYLAMQILDYVLFTMPGAPVRKKLIDAGLGKDVDSYYDGGIRQPLFSVIVKNAKKGNEALFIKTLEEALREQAENGLNKKAIYSAINNYEFKYREADFGRFPKGLIYGLNFLNSWLYDDTKALELADSLTPLARLKEKVETGYFEQLIKESFLENTHKAYVYLYPEVGKNERLEEELKEQLARMKDKLNAKQLNYLIEDTKKLKEFQETPSTQEELEKIPTLDLSDISREVLPFKNKEVTIGGTTAVVHEYHTNGIVYSDFCFDMSELPEELIPYATLLTEIYRYVDTEHFSYNDLATEINLKIGGLSFQTGMNVLVWKKDAYRPYFSVHMKCMENQVADGMSLLKEVLLSSKMDNKKRLKEIISELRTKMDTRIPAAGHVYAANRALSYIDPMMKYKDTAEGIGFYEFVKKLDKNFDSNADLLMKQLVRAQMCIFRKENLTLSLTGEFNFKSLMEGEMLQFNRMLYDMPCVKAVPAFVLEKKNEGFKTASKVQYVASAGCFEKEGQEYHGALKVLKTIFSYDYLWVNVRVTGGAYGCMCNFSRNGYGFFTSYRDPNLSATLDVYKKAADYVRNFEAGKRDMTKYIIGTISGIDQPLEPSALGERSFHAYQSGITVEMIQKERNQVLDATEETIRSLADYIESMMGAGTVCAIGNDRKLEEEKEMFKQVCSLNQ